MFRSIAQLSTIALCVVMCSAAALAEGSTSAPLARLGEMLFSDVNLSVNRGQSCASCHMPERAFSDGRDIAGGAASPSYDGLMLGDRNAPTASVVPRAHPARGQSREAPLR